MQGCLDSRHVARDAMQQFAKEMLLSFLVNDD